MILRWLLLLSLVLTLSANGMAETIAITSLDLSKIQQGWGSPQVDCAVEKHPLTIHGENFAHGLGTHADSYLAIKLAQGSSQFTAKVGVDDEARNSIARVKFFVYGDGKIFGRARI